MKAWIGIAILTLGLLTAPLNVDAGQRGHAAGNRSHSPGVNHRQPRQTHRIERGVRSGELTRRETRGLAREQRDFRQENRDYMSDGELTRQERIDLHRDLNEASRDIYHQKHDADKRFNLPPGEGDSPPATRDTRVNTRQFNQRHRITGGVKSGELTQDEVKELATERKDIRQEERKYKSDGTLTKDERKDLNQDLNSSSRDIYEEKHDNEKQEVDQ